MEVTQLSLDDGHADLLSNGSFEHGLDRWFVTSDMHLAWHIKNTPLQIAFEQGVLGVVAWLALCVAAIAIIRRQSAWPGATAAFAAALIGLLVVGCFDSILDSPRVILLVALIGAAGLYACGGPKPAPRSDSACRRTPRGWHVACGAGRTRRQPHLAAACGCNGCRKCLMRLGQSPILRHSAKRIVLFALCVGLGTGLVVLARSLMPGALRAGPGVESVVDEQVLPKLPPPAESPRAELPHFKRNHPRLPAPTVREYDLLHQANPSFLDAQRRRAAGGSGDLDAAILMARLEPGSQNLALLRDRLVGLSFEWRGADQTKPLAVAYDWLYEQWSPTDRRVLLRKATRRL